MKPSERRALEAEKRAQKEALEREKAFEKQAKDAEKYDGNNAGAVPKTDNDSERINTNAEYRHIPKGDIEVQGDGYHREGFFGRNVRLITFIITATLVLTVLGPWGIDMMVGRSRSTWADKGAEDGVPLTVAKVVAFSEMGYDFTWAHLDGYGYEDSSYTKKGKTTYNHKYLFEESDMLCLEVIGSSDKGVPDIVRLIDYESGDFIDIRKDDAYEFLQKYGYIE
jgi:hypothetical protein